jgi:hypothetical protein
VQPAPNDQGSLRECAQCLQSEVVSHSDFHFLLFVNKCCVELQYCVELWKESVSGEVVDIDCGGHEE